MHKPLCALVVVLAAPGGCSKRQPKKSPGEPGLQVRYLSDFWLRAGRLALAL